MIARLASGHEVALFDTGIGHAGELLDDILSQRAEGLPAPTVMSDALSSNHIAIIAFIKSLCNSHGRRNFVDVISNFPDEVEWVLEQYKLIWVNDSEVEEKNLSLAERLTYHKKHSLPVVESIRTWGAEKLSSEAVEENSGLGKGIRYFEKNYDGLIQFCVTEGARLDNNLMEQQIKLIVRNRKNASFFKTSVGADVGDVITSMIATVSQSSANLFDYLTVLQRNAKSVKENPGKWLPWNHEENKKA